MWDFKFWMKILPWIISLTLLQIPAAKSLKIRKHTKSILHKTSSHTVFMHHSAGKKQSYFDCAEKLAAAYMAASTSTLSWESRLWRILWWAFFLSGMMEAKLPSILKRNKRKIDEFKPQIIWKACKVVQHCRISLISYVNLKPTSKTLVQTLFVFVHAYLPQSDGSGHRVVAVDDWKHPFDKFVHIEDLFKMFLALLSHFQHTETQKIVPEIRETFFLNVNKEIYTIVKPVLVKTQNMVIYWILLIFHVLVVHV